jgi:glycine/D-amino acid oxidase-like deaminating enzyme
MLGPSVAIVGGGIMGLSAARALLKAGCEVTVLEQASIPNPLGSSVDDHRLIRFPYGDKDGYVRMVSEAYLAWSRLWEELGETLYIETGTLAFDAFGQGWLTRSRESLERCGILHEMLEPRRVAESFPVLNVEGITEWLYLPSGGALLAERIVRALYRRIGELGGQVRPHSRVASVDPAAGAVDLEHGERISADMVVVAAGPWVTRLCRELESRVTPSRQVVAYLTPPAEHESEWARAPMVLAIDPEDGFYAVPPVAGLGLKVGDHRFTLAGDPDLDREPSEAEARAIAGLCRGRFRDFERYRIKLARTCFYDVEPTESFIVEPLDARGWVMSGFSGHGFKFAPLLGERLKAAMLGEMSAVELASWAAGRLQLPERGARSQA